MKQNNCNNGLFYRGSNNGNNRAKVKQFSETKQKNSENLAGTEY